MDGADPADRAREVLGFSRWWQVAAAAVMMGLVSPYQYVWSSIEGPIGAELGFSPTALGLVFTLFVLFQAGSQFPVGWYRDRHGPRALTLLAGVLAGGGYVGLAYATELWQLYLLYSLGAVGVGIVYTVAVNTALKWFPDRRGTTTGIGTMAFAGGSALFVPYVRANATAAGYPDVLRNMGLLIGVGILLGAVVLRDPPTDWLAGAGSDAVEGDPAGEDPAADGGDPVGEVDSGDADADPGPGDARGDPDEGGSRAGGEGSVGDHLDGRQFTSREMLGTWQFWVMYGMFVGVSGAGLMLTAKIVAFSGELGLAAGVATLSATVLPLSGGAGRLIVGNVSDRVDRERAMAASFLLCGVGVLAVVGFGMVGTSLGFVAAVVIATFFWSPQYTLFPSVVGDYYGQAHSSANYALLYSGKVWGGVFGGAVTGWLVTVTSWETTFAVGGIGAIIAGLAALVLRSPRE